MQTEKRAADNKQAACSRRGNMQPVCCGDSQGACPLAHNFAKQSVVCYTFCQRSPSGTPPPLAVWQRFPCERTWEPCGLVWAYVNGLLRHMLRPVRYSTFPLTTPFACSLDEAGGAGAEPPKKLTITANTAEPVLP